MITVTIHRETLEHHRACAEGLALYDQIAALQPESDTRRDRRIKIANWTRLHSIWPYVAGYSGFARWLEAQGIIPRADFSGADLSHVNLHGADLSGANLSYANLSRANLHGAYLFGAYLSGAYLSRADLSGANLSCADLSGAGLSGADLSGADLSGANLFRADLSGAYRGASPAIPGWRTLATGYLEREEVGRAAE
jgi:hypothetical protein